MYKRQAYALFSAIFAFSAICPIKFLQSAFVGAMEKNNIAPEYIQGMSVSYTHLDVYKRQTKSMKIQAEIDKVKAKISEQQARLKELEQKKLEAENSEIVDIVRGMSISLTELPLLFEKLKDGGTLGQSVPKSEEEKEEN